jgi:hypothetical protein
MNGSNLTCAAWSATVFNRLIHDLINVLVLFQVQVELLHLVLVVLLLLFDLVAKIRVLFLFLANVLDGIVVPDLGFGYLGY